MSNRDCHGYNCNKAGKNICERSQAMRPRVQGRVINSGQSLGWNAEGSFFYSGGCSWITEIERTWLRFSTGNAGLEKEKKIQKYCFHLHYGFYGKCVRCKRKGGYIAFSSTQELLALHSAWAYVGCGAALHPAGKRWLIHLLHFCWFGRGTY